ncbi:MAG: helix-turn-helix domain-containing protein [Oscillospiraceae bacterium]|nr:helix-turn-helix domain-containing protein [Oscillospiraceae bacterium]
MIPLGEIIGKLRYERKLSQAQLAKKIGLKGSSTIAAYEQGSRFPSLDRLIRLSRVFGVTTDYLLGITKEETVVLDVSGLTPRQIEILDALIENFREDSGNCSKSNDV